MACCSQINTVHYEVISPSSNLNIFNKLLSSRNCILLGFFCFGLFSFCNYHLPKMLDLVYLVNLGLLSCEFLFMSLALNVLFHYNPMFWSTHNFTENLLIEDNFNREYLLERQKAFYCWVGRGVSLFFFSSYV